MSRAEYIWVVRESLDGNLLAAFTVRYECADWLSRYIDLEDDDITVCRMRNSHRHPKDGPVYLDPATLEPIKTRKEES
jgi:hypothetical protein